MSGEDTPSATARFEGLFRAYQNPIFRYLYRLVGESATAEELAQEAFVRAYSALPRLPADANERAWVYRIATNIAFDHLRRRRLVQWLPFLDRDAAHASGSRPDMRVGEDQAVQAALSRMHAEHRAALVLFSVEGYSVREIAQMLGISEGAVKTRLCRARGEFRRAYGEDEEHALR